MSEFAPFAAKIAKRFTDLQRRENLFVVHIAPGKLNEDKNPLSAGDALWLAYIAAFPAGTNPVFRERTEHDCSSCRQFVKNLGSVVAIVDGKLETVWDVEELETPYKEVAARLHKLVSKSHIESLFRVSEQKFGLVFNIEALEDGKTRRWSHLHGDVTRAYFTSTVDKDRGEFNTKAAVFRRGLTELSVSDMDSVIGLIEDNALYRGEEHLPAITAFRKLKVAYDKLKTDGERNLFVWSNTTNRASLFRNTVIGTLLQDLAKGEDMESAVRSFEAKVAPTNYKRPKALVTSGMVKEAMKTINELELEDALARRFAKIGDVSVNNVIWVNNEARSHMKGGVEDLLTKNMQMSAPKTDKAEDISVSDFMAKVVPKTTEMEILVKNAMASQFVTLTAPVHADVYKLFKWDNEFAWSYQGGVTDSIKERVKTAGGNVTNAKLRVSLAWFNGDDLDLHMVTPDGEHLYFGNKRGILDVDMNAGYSTNDKDPVENMSFKTLRDGVYKVAVHQFNKRSTSNGGFELEVENDGRLDNFRHATDLRVKQDVQCLNIHIKGGKIAQIDVGKGLEGGSQTKTVWNVNTETFVKVKTLMKSPNHWDGNEVGNRHWFFMLEDCKTDEPVRGIYNEFLNGRLEKHRRVFEVLGDKTKCQPTDDQLSGVGFSSTRSDQVVVRVAGAKSRKLYNVIF